MTRRGCFLYSLMALAGPLRAADAEIRFLCFAPSPYTKRHDAARAGAGIRLSLDRLIREHKLPLRTAFYDAMPLIDDAERGKALLRGARVLVFGAATWAQGSAPGIRRFFELTDLEPLTGVPVSAWVSAGGAHTGGEQAILDIFRTAIGMGAQVFSMGQKLMVFSTDERLNPPEGQFSLLDCWYMEEFAKAIAVAGLAGGDRDRAAAVSKQVNWGIEYWKRLPKAEAEIAARYGGLREKLNAAADENSAAWREIRPAKF